MFFDPATGAADESSDGPAVADEPYFWFFDPGNVDALVKSANGPSCAAFAPDGDSIATAHCPGRFWFFAGSVTNVKNYRLIVTDTEAAPGSCNAQRTFRPPVFRGLLTDGSPDVDLLTGCTGSPGPPGPPLSPALSCSAPLRPFGSVAGEIQGTLRCDQDIGGFDFTPGTTPAGAPDIFAWLPTTATCDGKTIHYRGRYPRTRRSPSTSGRRLRPGRVAM
jgi:hypothetical protein